ncbi:hypothetical protein BDV93DRAFT_554525 [Ceratobasidium sp. AG-I]|nr:hypothetical protein BDV93DRAFT_554525 [Ceratobasidium sp. AG-I]
MLDCCVAATTRRAGKRPGQRPRQLVQTTTPATGMDPTADKHFPHPRTGELPRLLLSPTPLMLAPKPWDWMLLPLNTAPQGMHAVLDGIVRAEAENNIKVAHGSHYWVAAEGLGMPTYALFAPIFVLEL